MLGGMSVLLIASVLFVCSSVAVALIASGRSRTVSVALVDAA